MGIYKKSLSYAILTVLEKSIDSYVRFEDFTYKTHLYAFSDRYQQNLPKSALSKALSRLKNQGFIEKVDINGELIIQLTHTGKEYLEDGSEKNLHWDGKWRIVIFDIPEQKRIIRNLFRRNLKKWGFKPLQKSVWISKKDVFEKLSGYIKDLKIDKWVTVIESNNITPVPVDSAIVQ